MRQNFTYVHFEEQVQHAQVLEYCIITFISVNLKRNEIFQLGFISQLLTLSDSDKQCKYNFC